MRRKCSVGFYLSDNKQYCLPNCEHFNQRSQVEYLIFKVLLLISCLTGMTAAVVIILSFIVQCRNTLVDPYMYYKIDKFSSFLHSCTCSDMKFSQQFSSFLHTLATLSSVRSYILCNVAVLFCLIRYIANSFSSD